MNWVLSGLANQAQRPGPRGATIATRARRPGWCSALIGGAVISLLSAPVRKQPHMTRRHPERLGCYRTGFGGGVNDLQTAEEERPLTQCAPLEHHPCCDSSRKVDEQSRHDADANPEQRSLSKLAEMLCAGFHWDARSAASRPQLSDGGHEVHRLQPRRPAAAWLGGTVILIWAVGARALRWCARAGVQGE
jgi:hypothetical protein